MFNARNPSHLKVLSRHDGAHSVHQTEIFPLNRSETDQKVKKEVVRICVMRQRTAQPPAFAACDQPCTRRHDKTT